jgi:putative oxidoreductase
MASLNGSTSYGTRLIIPPLRRVYAAFGDLTFMLMRVIAGVALMVHGYGKVTDPFGAVGMVESLGFVPGAFWSPLLSFSEFFGGLLLALGLLTRPAAVAASVILLVTIYYHWIFKDQGWSGSEKSILWVGMTLFFAVHGGGRLSVDRRIGKEF